MIIEKVTLTMQGITVEAKEIFAYDDDSTAEETYTRNYKREAHPDLLEAFKALGEHLANICKCEVTAIEVTGMRIQSLQDEKARGLITGKLLSFDNQKVSINTPFLHLETTAYPLRKQLNALLIECESEVRQYMFAGKVAQPTLWEQGMKIAS